MACTFFRMLRSITELMILIKARTDAPQASMLTSPGHGGRCALRLFRDVSSGGAPGRAKGRHRGVIRVFLICLRYERERTMLGPPIETQGDYHLRVFHRLHSAGCGHGDGQLLLPHSSGPGTSPMESWIRCRGSKPLNPNEQFAQNSGR